MNKGLAYFGYYSMVVMLFSISAYVSYVLKAGDGAFIFAILLFIALHPTHYNISDKE